MSHYTKELHPNDPLVGPERHADLALLDEYHRGRLSAPQEDQVRQHLVLCRRCQELLLDWAAFLDTEHTPSRFWSAELTSAWEEWLDLKERALNLSAEEEAGLAQLAHSGQ